MPARLDAREARPLTDREMTKLLCAILMGVANVEKDAVSSFPEALKRVSLLSDPDPKSLAKLLEIEKAHPRENNKATWMTALEATVGGLSSWCKPKDVRNAVQWVSENLHKMFALPS